MRRIYAIYVIVAIAVLTQAGCRNDYEAVYEPYTEILAEYYTETPAPPPVADFGGTLTLTMRSPLTLNPLLNECETVDRVLALVFERLFIMTDGQRPVPNPALVLDYSPAEDGRSVTVYLREDVFWSDGTNFTAHDAAFSIDFLRNNAPTAAVHRSSVQGISSATATDSHTLRVNFNEPTFFPGYTLGVPIVPRDYYRNISAAHARQMNPVGNGPFRLYSFSLGRGLVLTASENSARKPYIEFVDVRFLDNTEQDLNALVNNVSDALILLEAGSGGLAGRANLRTEGFVSGHFDFAGFNFDGIMADINLRSMAAHAIPYHLLIDIVYAGEAVLAQTPVSPGSWLYSPDIPRREFDLEAAAMYLEEFLYENTGEEEEGNGPEIRILYNTESPEREHIALMLASSLHSLGVPAVLIPAEWGEFTALLQSGEFDIFLGGFNLSADPDMRFMLYSANAGGTNTMRYRSDGLDALLREAALAANPEDKAAVYNYIQRYIADEMPIIGIAFRAAVLAVNTRVMGPLCVNGVFQNIEGWFLDVR